MQALHLSNGSAVIAAGSVSITLFVDAQLNAIRIRAQSTSSQALTSAALIVESVRNLGQKEKRVLWLLTGLPAARLAQPALDRPLPPGAPVRAV